MKFPDESFDIIYSCHSLEHSFVPQQVINEIIRVSKKNAMIAIEVPVAYKTGGADLIEFNDLDTLHGYFYPFLTDVLCSERESPDTHLNKGGNTIIRTIFQINKDSVSSITE